MPIPGSNLLKKALGVIGSQTLSYYKASGRSLNSIGQDVTTYALPVSVKGSFQPVPKALYAQFGLDFTKDYFNFFVSKDLVDITRDVSNDLLVFNSVVYQCESATKWYQIDGWLQMLCCASGEPIPN